MNFFSQDFLDNFKQDVLKIISDAFERMLAMKEAQSRYKRFDEAVRYAQVSDSTFRRWTDSSKGLKKIIIEGVTLYDVKDIDEFMESHKV